MNHEIVERALELEQAVVEDREEAQDLCCKAIDVLHATACGTLHPGALFGAPVGGGDAPGRPLQQVEADRAEFVQVWERLGAIMRSQAVALLRPMVCELKGGPEEDREVDVDEFVLQRYHAIRTAADAHFSAILSAQRIRDAARNRQTEPEYGLGRCDPTEKHDPRLMMIKKALALMQRHRYRKYGGEVMKPCFTREGHFTQTYERVASIDEIVCGLFDSLDQTGLWEHFATQFVRNKQNIVAYLQYNKNPEFPELQQDQRLHAFENGIFNTGECVFRPFGDERIVIKYFEGDEEEEEEPEMAAAAALVADAKHSAKTCERYHRNKLFPLLAAPIPDSNSIPTPFFDSIFEAQYGPLDNRAAVLPDSDGLACDLPEVMRFINGMLGRLQHKVGSENDGDGFQVGLMLKGMPGVGKGIITKVVESFHDPINVGTLANNAENRFGLQSLYRRNVIIMNEIKANFGNYFDWGQVQQAISSDRMSIPRKNDTPVQVTWKSPWLFNTNDNIPFPYAMVRRLIVVNFPNEIPEEKRIDDLDKKVLSELPSIMVKMALAYRELKEKVKETGSVMSAAPPYFAKQRERLRKRCNSLAAFIDSDSIVQGEHMYIALDSFDAEYRNWCKAKSAHVMALEDETLCGSTLKRYRLKIVKARRRDPVTQREKRCHWIEGVGLSEDFDET
jgi:phage/plasmid-associated DNA primase